MDCSFILASSMPTWVAFHEAGEKSVGIKMLEITEVLSMKFYLKCKYAIIAGN